MKLPNLQALNKGVLVEPIHDTERIALWVPGAREGGFQTWERIGSVSRAEILVEQGLCATAANAIRARQRIQGLLGKILQTFRGKSEPSWLLPNGQSAEQEGQRQTDVMLVWPEDPANPVDEARIKTRWPQSTRVQALAGNLFVVFGVTPPSASLEPMQLSPANPREAAQQLLTAADKSSDLGKKATALTDLGVAHLREGDFVRAAALLEQALTLARQLQDRTRERDVLGNLGLAVAGTQPQRAFELFEQELALAKEAGDRFGEKNALNNLGLYHASFRDPRRAYPYFEQAANLARAVGDPTHEADMLWQMAILHAELGERDQLLSKAQAAIDLLASLRRPQAQTLREHLQKYLAAEGQRGLGGIPAAGAVGGAAAFGSGAVIAGGWASQVNPWSAPGSPPTSGPGLLRMAVSVTKSMARFLGSGLKRVAPDVHQKRLRTCATCEHHTGVRCRVCGCFTNVKAWLPHEDCPISKWPKL
jgi:tetratricopeptide (TPR) repeat protein